MGAFRLVWRLALRELVARAARRWLLCLALDRPSAWRTTGTRFRDELIMSVYCSMSVELDRGECAGGEVWVLDLEDGERYDAKSNI